MNDRKKLRNTPMTYIHKINEKVLFPKGNFISLYTRNINPER